MRTLRTVLCSFVLLLAVTVSLEAATASGGTTPYAWSIAAGSLPPGLKLTASTGAISGKATTLGTFSFTVRVTDSQSPAATATKTLTITVTR